MQRAKQLSIAYKPASDIAARYFALQTGRLNTPGYQFTFGASPIESLDQAARERRFDITTISATTYPEVADDYRVLSVGSNVDREGGPVLISQHYFHIDQLQFRRVGVAGTRSTGGCLLKWACPDALVYELPSDQIATAVASGQLDAGVLGDVPENCARQNLHTVVDLGKLWIKRMEMPLPIELNVISRRFFDTEAAVLCELLHESATYAQNHPAEALAWASRFNREPDAARKPSRTGTLANPDSMAIADDVRLALGMLLPLVKELGFSSRDLPTLDIQERSAEANSPMLAASAA
jgi:1,4-dihydroxy-6-naphthoate synthase